jgi:hypothetical protein
LIIIYGWKRRPPVSSGWFHCVHIPGKIIEPSSREFLILRLAKTLFPQKVRLGIGFWDANLNEKQFKLPPIWSKKRMVSDPNLAGSAV